MDHSQLQKSPEQEEMLNHSSYTSLIKTETPFFLSRCLLKTAVVSALAVFVLLATPIESIAQSDAKGSDTKGSDTKGSMTKDGSDTKGSMSKGSDTKGSMSKGSMSKGSMNKGTGEVAGQAGLVTEWTSHIGGNIVDMYIDVSYFGLKKRIPPPTLEGGDYISLEERENLKPKFAPEPMTTISFLIEYDGQTERISQNDFDAFGKRLGVAGAKKQAGLRKEIIELELKARGKAGMPIEVTKLELPTTSIYSLSRTGVVTAMDGDTGRIKWKRKIGQTRLPSIGVGASSNYVAATNGSSVYCMNAKNGKVLWSRKCINSPSASPAVSDDYIYVPLMNNRVEVFALKSDGLGREVFVTSGRGTARPLVTASTVSWPTSTGYYNVAPVDSNKQMSYRMKASGEIIGAGAGKSGILFVASTDGYLRGLNEKRGSLMWEFSTGERISQDPLVIGNYVHVITDSRKLYRVNARTGKAAPGWSKPISGYTKLVGGSENRLYALNGLGNVTVIDPQTGSQIGRVPGSPLNLVLQNGLTDRLYVGNRSGLISCMRETGKRYPSFHAGDFVDLAKAGSGTKGGSGTKDDGGSGTKGGSDSKDGSDTKDDDPFASSDASDDEDPFDSDADASADEDEDPFGTDSSDEKEEEDEDPFGGGEEEEDEDEDEDPFGGGTP